MLQQEGELMRSKQPLLLTLVCLQGRQDNLQYHHCGGALAVPAEHWRSEPLWGSDPCCAVRLCWPMCTREWWLSLPHREQGRASLWTLTATTQSAGWVARPMPGDASMALAQSRVQPQHTVCLLCWLQATDKLQVCRITEVYDLPRPGKEWQDKTPVAGGSSPAQDQS